MSLREKFQPVSARFSAMTAAVKKFMQSQGDLNRQLLAAAQANNLDAVRESLAAGAEVGRVSLHDENPLAAAVAHGNLEMVKVLMTAGESPVVRLGYHGSTPFHNAVMQGRADIVTHMIDSGTNVNDKAGRGNSALALAISYRRTEMTDLLLARGADVNIRNSHGWTPIFFAVQNNDIPCIKKLLAAGARADLLDSRRDTGLLDIARENDYFEAFGIVQAHLDAQVPVWQKTAEDQVTHVSTQRAQGYRLTEIFNLDTSLLTVVTHNFKTGKDTVALRTLDPAADKALLDTARARLQAPVQQ